MNQYIEVMPNVCRVKGELTISDRYPWVARVMVPQSLIGTSGVFVEASTGAAFVSAGAESPSRAVEALEASAGSTILRAIIERQLKEVKDVDDAKQKSKSIEDELRKTIRDEFRKMMETSAQEE